MREVFLRDRKVQELIERSPAFLHLEDEESVWWDLPLNLLPPLREKPAGRELQWSEILIKTL